MALIRSEHTTFSPTFLIAERRCIICIVLWFCTKFRQALCRKGKEAPMLKTITSSDLRVQVKHVLNEVGYGQNQYIVEKFGEPTAAIISMADFRLLQEVRQAQTADSLAEAQADYYRYPLRCIGQMDIDPSAPALTADEWDAERGVLLNDPA